MRRLALGLAALAALGAAAQAKPQRSVASLPSPVTEASIGGQSRAPMGWIEFCRTSPAHCTTDTREPERVALDTETWRLISSINRKVNADIEPVTDKEHWGVVERWSLPDDGRGDCEDYALLKRKLLAEAGLPRRALLMTVVIDETGGGHAILTVRTDRGDFILDNKRNAILGWTATNYRFVKREGQMGMGWVDMDEPGTAVATAAR